MNSVTAIIPAYNEESRIYDTVLSVKSYVDHVIVIDDNSLDNTAGEAMKAGAKLIRQPNNQGYIAAIKRGFTESQSDLVVTIDADGEFPAAEIPNLLQPISSGLADMVQGKRNFVPRISERFLTWFANRKGFVGDSGTGFRAIRSELAKELELKGACICGIFSLEVLSKNGRIVEIPIQLNKVNKPRKIAWYHLRQFFYVLPWMIRIFED